MWARLVRWPWATKGGTRAGSIKGGKDMGSNGDIGRCHVLDGDWSADGGGHPPAPHTASTWLGSYGAGWRRHWREGGWCACASGRWKKRELVSHLNSQITDLLFLELQSKSQGFSVYLPKWQSLLKSLLQGERGTAPFTFSIPEIYFIKHSGMGPSKWKK